VKFRISLEIPSQRAFFFLLFSWMFSKQYFFSVLITWRCKLLTHLEISNTFNREPEG
jgi:hypothetical protein